MEDLHGGVVGFLAGNGVKTRGGELAEFVEYCLGGGFIRDGGADIILFKEMAETGEVTRARERRESVSCNATLPAPTPTGARND